MDGMDMYSRAANFDDERYEFLSSVWSESLLGAEQLPVPTSYVSNALQNVLLCEELTLKVPFKRKYLGLKRPFKAPKETSYDRLEARNDMVLLDKVSAEIKGGEILAVLGPSGAGKTLFLSALLGQPSVKDGKILGEVSLNGRPLSDKTQSVAFVPQKDLAVDSLTIDEHLQFVASLRLWRETKQVHTARINELLLQMNLVNCRRCELRFLSTGERKRVSIATQFTEFYLPLKGAHLYHGHPVYTALWSGVIYMMMIRPAVLLLDEPLTGLDAAVSDAIITAVARIAQPSQSHPQGCAVVCVLHQPRPQTLRFVSKVMLLTDGRVAFYGTPAEAEQFYYRLNPTSEPEYGAWNAILESFMAKLHRPETANYIVDIYRRDVCYQNKPPARAVVVCFPMFAKVDVSMTFPKTRAPWRTQLKCLLWRETMDIKHLKVFDLSTVLFLATAVLLGLWYSKADERNQAGIQTASGLLFIISSEIIFTNSYAVMHSFAPQVPILLREKRLYGPSAFYFSKVLSLLPKAAVHTILFVVFLQLSSGNLSGDGGIIDVFLPICGILVIVGVAGTSFGFMLAGLSNSPETAYRIAQPIDLITHSFGGIFGDFRKNSLNIEWLKYISSFFYSFECLSILYWGSVKQFDCSESTLQCPTSESVLAKTGFSAGNLLRDIILLCVYIVLCHSIGFLAHYGMFCLTSSKTHQYLGTVHPTIETTPIPQE